MRIMNLKGLGDNSKLRISLAALIGVFALFLCSASYAAVPLPSWNDGAAKTVILEFVAAVTEKGGKVA